MSSPDWEAVISARLNLLLEGDAVDTERCLSTLVPRLPYPALPFSRDAPSSDGVRAIIVREIAQLSTDDQQRLLALVESGNGAVHVISTSSSHVFQLVRAGRFLPTLYYRLNVIRLEVASGDGPR